MSSLALGANRKSAPAEAVTPSQADTQGASLTSDTKESNARVAFTKLPGLTPLETNELHLTLVGQFVRDFAQSFRSPSFGTVLADLSDVTRCPRCRAVQADEARCGHCGRHAGEDVS